MTRLQSQSRYWPGAMARLEDVAISRHLQFGVLLVNGTVALLLNRITSFPLSAIDGEMGFLPTFPHHSSLAIISH